MSAGLLARGSEVNKINFHFTCVFMIEIIPTYFSLIVERFQIHVLLLTKAQIY